MSILLRPWIAALVIGSVLIAVALATAIVPMTKAYWSIALSNRASAYKLGILSTLRSDDLHAIWEGRTPDILFRARERDDNNKYVWQEAALERSGSCLDLVSTKTGQPLEPPADCARRDKLVPSANRLHFRVAADRAITIGVSAGPPKNGNRIARGALFGVDGQIGVGLNYDTGTFFKIEFDATALDPEDVRPEADAKSPARPHDDDDPCDDARLVRLRSIPLLSLLPAMPAKLCRYRSKNDRTLALVHYRSGAMQMTRFTDVVMCQALLAQLLPPAPNLEAAGCLGARWNERVDPGINLVLFDTTTPAAYALFR